MPAVRPPSPAATTPTDILELAYRHTQENTALSFLRDARIADDVEFVCRCASNRASVRMLMACLLATLSDSRVDIRKPFRLVKPPKANKTARSIDKSRGSKDPGSYSGRTYDERYVGPFVLRHQLPVNATTSFLTPAYRTNPITLTRTAVLTGKPPELYRRIVALINDVHEGTVAAQDMLAEIMRLLLLIKSERQLRMQTLIASLRPSQKSSLLSAEAIVNLIRQHLASPRSSRLPVLVVAAAYHAARNHLGERHLSLHSHHAADIQTQALGDVEIALADEQNVVTVYEMKAKQVTREDVDIAVQKLANSSTEIDNYIFITTDRIDAEIEEYAASLHARLGVEFVILDCLGFIRHFLHLFYRLRSEFLEAYQNLLLAEPESAVNQSLKEVFLSLRLAAESGSVQLIGDAL